MSSFWKQIEKSVNKFMVDGDDERTAWHEAGHMLVFRKLMSNADPFFKMASADSLLVSERPAVDFKKRSLVDLHSAEYITGLVAGYAAELLNLKLTDRAVISACAKRLISSARTAKQMGILQLVAANDDSKFFIIVDFSDDAELMLSDYIDKAIKIIKEHKNEFLDIVSEYKTVMAA